MYNYKNIVNNLQKKHPSTIDLSLGRINNLLEKLDNPHLKIPPTIHVAGTNGKGSTIAFLRAILEDAGYKVHVYTSPHLVKYNERIVLQGKEISDEYLCKLLKIVDKATDEYPVTLFEAITTVAFLAFSEIPADIVLLETGLGGRLDATNVTTPILSVVTPISIDHSEFLGDTLEKITAEKFGILKKGVPCVVSKQEIPIDNLKDWIPAFARMTYAESFNYGEDYFIKNNHYVSDSLEIPLDNLSLLGEHQKINASTAIACTENIKDSHRGLSLQRYNSFNISKQNIINGLANANWKARMQQISSNIWLDGGHNEAGAKAISEYINNNWQDEKVILIFGMLKTKYITNYLKYFTNVDMIYGVNIFDEKNGFSGEEIADFAKELNIPVKACNNYKLALDDIKVKHNNANILICGSLYLAGEVLKDMR